MRPSCAGGSRSCSQQSPRQSRAASISSRSRGLTGVHVAGWLRQTRMLRNLTMKDSSLTLPRGELVLPAFLPDATRGVVRSVDTTDLYNAGVRALVMNV